MARTIDLAPNTAVEDRTLYYVSCYGITAHDPKYTMECAIAEVLVPARYPGSEAERIDWIERELARKHGLSYDSNGEAYFDAELVKRRKKIKDPTLDNVRD